MDEWLNGPKESIYIPCPTGNVLFEDIANEDLIFIEEQRSPEYWLQSHPAEPDVYYR